MHLALDAAVLPAEVSRQPGVDVEDVPQLLAEALPIVGGGDRRLIRLRWRERGVDVRSRNALSPRLGHRSHPPLFFPTRRIKFDRICQTSPSRSSSGSAGAAGNRMPP